MAGWADDPELLATFRAEVDERLASLSAGLLQLEEHPSPRQLITVLFRDAHTVKGSARMLGLDGVLQVAHASEDLLGALRDGRLAVRRDLVDLLLASSDAIGAAVMNAGDGRDDATAEAMLPACVAALEEALAGGTFVVPLAPTPVAEDDEPEPELEGDRHRLRTESVRVAAHKVYELLDTVGEAELDARRVEQAAVSVATVTAEHGRWLKLLRDVTANHDTSALPDDIALALNRLFTGADDLVAAGRELREIAEDSRSRVAQVRDGAMGLAMVPVRRVLAAFPRLVRDVASATGKEVRFISDGADVELDKQVLDGVADALKHLVINAVDHGCELPADRAAAGKSAEATVTVSARSAGGTVVLEVSDDGCGIDADAVRRVAIERGLLPADSTMSGAPLLALLFAPAMSTAETVTETSGRGVGLDVVHTAVEDLGGAVEIRTEQGKGTTFAVTLPLTLGVIRCLVARVGDERYAVPVPAVVESVSLRDVAVHTLAGATVLVRHGSSIPLLDLGEALAVHGERSPKAAVLVRHTATGEQLAWAVDRLEGELELVVKDLGPFLGRIPLVTGATIDGDGSVVCLVDLRELAIRVTNSSALSGSAIPEQREPVSGTRRPKVLVVEDSVGVRELERAILEGAGFDVVTCVDGLDGAARLREDPVDLVLSDVEMPGMDGFTLTRTIRMTRGWEQVPVIIMTSRGDEADRRAGLEAGASAYLLKHEFDQQQLVDTVRRLVGR
jgi:chemotaxis protein histidine kinase CheA